MEVTEDTSFVTQVAKLRHGRIFGRLTVNHETHIYFISRAHESDATNAVVGHSGEGGLPGSADVQLPDDWLARVIFGNK